MEQVVEVVWNTLNTCLTQFIRRRVPDNLTADDLLQEVYVKIHTHVNVLRDPDRLEAWVFQIARNVINDYYRAQRPLDEITDRVPAPEADEMDEEVIERLRIGVRRVVDMLPDEYREAILLTEYQGLTQQAMAERLGISLPAAKSRVLRGKKMMRQNFLLCCRFQFDQLGKVVDYTPRC